MVKPQKAYNSCNKYCFIKAICRAFDANLIAIESSDKNFLLEGYLQNRHPHGRFILYFPFKMLLMSVIPKVYNICYTTD